MPRSNSLSSNGSSLTSEEDNGAPAPALTANRNMNSGGSANGASTAIDGGTTNGRGLKRFQKAVNKVIMRNNVNSAFNPTGIGAEPGVDPRKPGADAAWGHIREHCEIEVIDYSTTNYEIAQYDNNEFVQYIRETRGEKPSWAKVRWINIAGVSWDVISRLGIAYDLHPLTLENILQGMRNSRSKADYYTNHLFLHIQCQTLKEKSVSASPLTHLRATSPRPLDHEAGPRKRQEKPDLEKGDIQPPEVVPGLDGPVRSNTQDRRNAAEDRIRQASKENALLREQDNQLSVHVSTKSLFLYLLRDGTVISVHESDRGFGDPIYNRLRTPNTVLRGSADPSMLLEAILDLVVDRAFDIVDRFHENILKCEQTILLSQKISAVRQLHLLSAELTQRRRALDPLKTLIYGLRRYDQDRSTAVAESSGTLAEGEKVPGFLSHKAKIYLADVHEHCEWILTSFEMFENISENLINYSFNIISYETNNTMRTLTLATIIFLPLTLLTGYFGMNFVRFDGVQHNSDAFFWEVGIPVFFMATVLFLWRDLVRAWHYLRKKTILSRSTRELDGHHVLRLGGSVPLASYAEKRIAAGGW